MPDTSVGALPGCAVSGAASIVEDGGGVVTTVCRSPLPRPSRAPVTERIAMTRPTAAAPRKVKKTFESRRDRFMAPHGSANRLTPGKTYLKAGSRAGARASRLARRQRQPEPLAGRLEPLRRRRLLHDLEVDDALAEGVERVAADDRVQRDAALPGPRADLHDHAAAEGALVERALARDDRAGRAHAGVEAERREDPRAAGLQHRTVRRGERAGEPAGPAAGRAARAGEDDEPRASKAAVLGDRLHGALAVVAPG